MELIQSSIKAEGCLLKHHFDKLTHNPQRGQKKYIHSVIQRGKNTYFGRKHGFAAISSIRDFQKQVPIHTYQDLEPYIERVCNGHANVLTAEMPFMFNLTSGTSDKPKYIPVTQRTSKCTSKTVNQWLYRCLQTHPEFLSRGNLTITSSAIESHTSAGIPCGSVSGLIYKNLPRLMHKSLVLPFYISQIQNYDLRYYAMMRLALEKDVSFIATPSPGTLIKLAETGISYQEQLVRSIYDGTLFPDSDFIISHDDRQLLNLISSMLKPNPSRSCYLHGIIEQTGTLMPYRYWPSLKLIGCWLGGTIGYQARKLPQYYGNTAKRDLGYMASEGSMTIPFEDSTSAGILALDNIFYEFIPEEEVQSINPTVLLCHELEPGKQYKILLTNESGLYRYDINDTIKVEGFYNQTPIISFVRKTADVLNIIGEKVHVNQLVSTIHHVSRNFNIGINQFRVIADLNELRYKIFICADGQYSSALLKEKVLPAMDSHLGSINMEYSQKRRSGRLHPPVLHIMSSDWEENIKKAALASGKRDIQYKWQPISTEFTNLDRNHITHSITMEN